jgi:hypothetical protein
MQHTLTILLRVVIAVLTPTSDADAEGLHRFAPQDVTVEQAREHVWAARVAAATYDLDPDELLSVSWHESRFVPNVVSHEPSGRVSCGVMTPVPQQPPCPIEPLVGQYLAGAGHLREWYDAARGNRWAALVGLAGGYALVALCTKEAPPGNRGCAYPAYLEWIEGRIRAAREEKQQS